LQLEDVDADGQPHIKNARKREMKNKFGDFLEVLAKKTFDE